MRSCDSWPTSYRLWHEHGFVTMGPSTDTLGYHDVVDILETALMHDGMKMGRPLMRRNAGTSI